MCKSTYFSVSNAKAALRAIFCYSDLKLKLKMRCQILLFLDRSKGKEKKRKEKENIPIHFRLAIHLFLYLFLSLSLSLLRFIVVSSVYMRDGLGTPPPLPRCLCTVHIPPAQRTFTDCNDDGPISLTFFFFLNGKILLYVWLYQTER